MLRYGRSLGRLEDRPGVFQPSLWTGRTGDKAAACLIRTAMLTQVARVHLTISSDKPTKFFVARRLILPVTLCGAHCITELFALSTYTDRLREKTF